MTHLLKVAGGRVYHKHQNPQLPTCEKKGGLREYAKRGMKRTDETGNITTRKSKPNIYYLTELLNSQLLNLGIVTSQLTTRQGLEVMGDKTNIKGSGSAPRLSGSKREEESKIF